MMTPALIASDVDGTLLDNDEKVTDRTRLAVHAAVHSGVRFVLATGRPPRWVQPVVDALGFAPMAVCANGAVIYDPSADRIVAARTLSTEALGELAEIATRVIPGAGLAVERVGRSAHDAATPQFVSSPGYEHAWLNPDNTVTGHTTRFKPTDTIYVSVLTDSAGSGTIGARWTFAGRVVSEPQKEVSYRGAAATEFHLQNSGGFPAGDYNVEILLDGKPIASREFRVEK